jgi:PAS domain S-box-containing protein
MSSLPTSEAHFRSLIENALDIITVTDRTSKVLYASPAVERVLGFSPQELTGKRVFTFIHPDDFIVSIKAFGRGLLTPGIPQKHRFRHRHKDGSWRMLESVGQYVKDNFGTRMIVNSRDVTDQEQLEKIVRQSEKLSAVGQLAAGVAHELNNPLGVILGFAQGLRQRLPEDSPLCMPVNSIERETLRCKSLVQELLLFSRESKQGTLAAEPIGVVEEALSLVETQARVRKVEIRRHFSAHLPQFEVDRTQIQQVLINLCTNAMDAMPKGGSIAIHISLKNPFIEIQVSDTGTGIPPDIRQKIFDPFFTTKEAGKGTGLGLSLAYEIIQKHHGTLECQSQLGQGTTFLIRLPLSPNQTQSARAA